METTIDVVDVSEFKYVKKAENYIPNFMRVIAATRFAKTIPEWIDIFKSYSSGTYSSQWMLIDYNKFKNIKGTSKKDKNLFYVVEQTPKSLVYHDISHYLFKVLINHLFIIYSRMVTLVHLIELSYQNQKLIYI